MRKDGRKRSQLYTLYMAEKMLLVVDIAKFSVEERIAILSAATELPVSVRAATRSLPAFFPLLLRFSTPRR